MWSSEGRVEGEVKMADDALHNRYRLAPETFGKEHTTRGILKLLTRAQKEKMRTRMRNDMMKNADGMKKMVFVSNKAKRALTRSRIVSVSERGRTAKRRRR